MVSQNTTQLTLKKMKKALCPFIIPGQKTGKKRSGWTGIFKGAMSCYLLSF